MTTLYIEQHGALIRKSDERLVVTHGKEELFSSPISKINQVVIFGNNSITSQALEAVLDNNIDVVYLTSNGHYRGRLQPATSQHVEYRRAQYEKAKNEVFCIEFSKSIVWAKIANGSHLIRMKGYRSETVDSSEWHRFQRYQRLVSLAKSMDAIRGYEGAASATYFPLLGRLLKDRMGFQQRIKHPPPDPINILLSLGYTLLFNQIQVMVDLVGLDPYQGFFHQTKPGHPSLVSDFMEEFRSPVIDSLVLRCVNLGTIRRTDFETSEQKSSLKKDGLRKYLEACNQRFNDFSGKIIQGKRNSFRQLFEYQCRHFARVVTGKEPQYRPFLER